MVNKKGKFRLLSYLVDSNLIYYNSVNKKKKILGFALFELSGDFYIDKILQNFVKRGLILFYSIEINIITPDKVIYILCINHNNKSEIFKIFNLISYKLNQVDPSILILKDNKLEKEFLKIISLDTNKNYLMSDIIGSIRVKNESSIITLDFYLMNLDNVPEPNEIIFQFMDYIKSIKRFGYLIFNFQLINNKISANIYYIDFINENDIQNSNLESNVNDFFGFELINKVRLKMKNIFYPLWRFRLTKTNSNFQYISKILNRTQYYNQKNLSKFILEFKQLMEVNGIEFNQFSQNLFFVEQSTLVIILVNRRFKCLMNIIKKFRSKYQLLVILLNNKDYDDLIKLDKINSIPNLKIINYEKFCQFDIKNLKINE